MPTAARTTSTRLRVTAPLITAAVSSMRIARMRIRPLRMMEDAILRAVIRLRRRISGIPGALTGSGSGSIRGDEVGGFGE